MQLEQQVSGFQISPRAERWSAAAGAIFIGVASAFVAAVDPTSVKVFPVCPFYQTTGFACPGCGLTRGFHALFHGDIVTALDFNALIPIWAVILAWVWVSLFFTVVRGKGLPMWPTRPNILWTFFI